MKLEAKNDDDGLAAHQQNIFTDAYNVDLSGSTFSLKQIKEIFNKIKASRFPINLNLTGCATTSRHATALLLEYLSTISLLVLNLTNSKIPFNNPAADKILKKVTGIHLTNNEREPLNLVDIFTSLKNNNNLSLLEITGRTYFGLLEAEAFERMGPTFISTFVFKQFETHVAEEERARTLKSFYAGFENNTFLRIRVLEVNGVRIFPEKKDPPKFSELFSVPAKKVHALPTDYLSRHRDPALWNVTEVKYADEGKALPHTVLRPVKI